MTLEDIPILQDLSEDMRMFVAQLLLLVVAIMLILFLRRALTWILVRPLRRLTQQTDMAYDNAILDAMLQPMRYWVIAAGLLVSVRILDVGDAITMLVSTLGRSLIIIGIAMFIYRLIGLFAMDGNRLFTITGLSIQDRLLPFIRTALQILIVVIGVIIIIQEWGYDVSGLIAGLGLGGLAISLAAKDTVENVFGFGSIVGDDPFHVGEYIVTSHGEGVVEHVGIRSTRIRRLDQALITVPNSQLASTAITNWSRLAKRRIDYIIGVTYDAKSDDLRVLMHRIREILSSYETVDSDSVTVVFTDFGASSLDILIRGYVDIADWGEFMTEKERINLEVMDTIAELGMSMAFPSQSLYLENLPDFTANNVPAKRVTSQSQLDEPDDAKRSPRERALSDEEAQARREAEPTPPEPINTKREGFDEDMPDDNK